jgi:hypothetical protein
VVLRSDDCDSWLLAVVRSPGDPADLRVVFPAGWPATPQGRGDLRCVNGSADWREHRRLGAAARAHDWILRAAFVALGGDDVPGPGQAVDVDLSRCGEPGPYGAVDVDGRFVVAPRFAWMGEPNNVLGTVQRALCPPLPEGRREARRWAEVQPLGEPTRDALDREVCDVIEVWSGQRVNPPGIKALAGTLSYGTYVACRDLTQPGHIGDGCVAPMHACQTEPPPLTWRRVGDLGVVIAAQSDKRGLWGYVDACGHAVVEPRFESASDFDSGLAIVKLARQPFWGVITFDFDEPVVDGMPCPPRMSWRWVLEPGWFGVAGEYDGHFTVADQQGRWGMVTPRGEAVTPFVRMRVVRDERFVAAAIHDHCRSTFSDVQQARFTQWLQDAREHHGGRLAAMAGRLFSSWRRYDHGALDRQCDIAVVTTREVEGIECFYEGGAHHAKVTLGAGHRFTWSPRQRHYAGFVDLSTHAVVGAADQRWHTLRLPWDALALAPVESTGR